MKLKHRRSKPKLAFAVLAAAVLLTSAIVGAALYSAHNAGTLATFDPDDNQPGIYPNNVPAVPASVTSSPGCDQSLWQHVHQPSRLKILDNCLQVSGTIAGEAVMGDGDYHILLRPDLRYIQLMNLKNLLFTGATLVTEAVCARPPIESDADAACHNFNSNIRIPAVGTHVVVKGPYVIDQPHGWTEIHPISSILAQ
ncbi:MAG TPA: hypothetical protein VGH44_05715 [Candidatus Saccharimonadia bacterium]|jgi:hypothetical protein